MDAMYPPPSSSRNFTMDGVSSLSIIKSCSRVKRVGPTASSIDN